MQARKGQDTCRRIWRTSRWAVLPWTGAAVVYSITGQKIATATWTRGWTSVDHLTINGLTYRAFYKAAGDPQKKPGGSGDQLGRFIIQRVGAGGIEGENLFDEPVGPNYSAARFVPLSNGQGGWNYRVYFYQRATGIYFSAGFDAQTGLSTPLTNGQIKDDEGVSQPYVDVEPYAVGTQTFMAFINDDNSKPFNYDQAEQMGRIIHDELVNKTVGYQFMLAQSGRVIYSRVWGKSSLGNLPAEQVNMTARTPINMGSASKMITTATNVERFFQFYLPAAKALPQRRAVNVFGCHEVRIIPFAHYGDGRHP